MAIDLSAWNPLDHPRDRLGRFRDKWSLSPAAKRMFQNVMRRFRPAEFRSDNHMSAFFRPKAQARARRWSNEQQASLDYYMSPTSSEGMPGWADVNSTLRANSTDMPQIRHMDSMMAPLDDDMILSRVVGPDAFGLTPEQMPAVEEWTGKLISDKAYISTNYGSPMQMQGPHIEMRILAPKGTRAIMANDGSRSVILDREQPLRITHVTEDGRGGFYVMAVAMPMRGNPEGSRALGRKLAPQEVAPAEEATPDAFQRRGMLPDGSPDPNAPSPPTPEQEEAARAARFDRPDPTRSAPGTIPEWHDPDRPRRRAEREDTGSAQEAVDNPNIDLAELRRRQAARREGGGEQATQDRLRELERREADRQRERLERLDELEAQERERTESRIAELERRLGGVPELEDRDEEESPEETVARAREREANLEERRAARRAERAAEQEQANKRNAAPARRAGQAAKDAAPTFEQERERRRAARAGEAPKEVSLEAPTSGDVRAEKMGGRSEGAGTFIGNPPAKKAAPAKRTAPVRMTNEERRDFEDLSTAEQTAYRRFRRSMSHDDAMQSAQDYEAAQLQRRIDEDEAERVGAPAPAKAAKKAVKKATPPEKVRALDLKRGDRIFVRQDRVGDWHPAQRGGTEITVKSVEREPGLSNAVVVRGTDADGNEVIVTGTPLRPVRGSDNRLTSGTEVRVAKKAAPSVEDIINDDALTVRQKRARLKIAGMDQAEIDRRVPTATAAKKAAKKAAPAKMAAPAAPRVSPTQRRRERTEAERIAEQNEEDDILDAYNRVTLENGGEARVVSADELARITGRLSDRDARTILRRMIERGDVAEVPASAVPGRARGDDMVVAFLPDRLAALNADRAKRPARKTVQELREEAAEAIAKEKAARAAKRAAQKVKSSDQPSARQTAINPSTGRVAGQPAVGRTNLSRIKPGERFLVERRPNGEWGFTDRVTTGKPVEFVKNESLRVRGYKAVRYRVVARDEDGNEIRIGGDTGYPSIQTVKLAPPPKPAKVAKAVPSAAPKVDDAPTPLPQEQVEAMRDIRAAAPDTPRGDALAAKPEPVKAVRKAAKAPAKKPTVGEAPTQSSAKREAKAMAATKVRVTGRLTGEGKIQFKSERDNPGWSDDENGETFEALNKYKDFGHKRVNGALMAAGGDLDKVQSPGNQREIRAIDRAMEASPLSSGVAVGRGISAADARAMFGDSLDGNMVGRGWSAPGFTSTTTNRTVVDRFAGPDGVELTILVPKGVGGVQLSPHGPESESEMLLQRGLRFKVIEDRGMVSSWDGRIRKRHLVVEATPEESAPVARPRPTGAPSTSAVKQAAESAPTGGPVSGAKSSKPIAMNSWGGRPAPGGVHFHEDGEIGRALEMMGSDREMDVDGEPLANVLGRIATDVVIGSEGSRTAIGKYRAIAARLPEGSAARRMLERAIDRMDVAVKKVELPAGIPLEVRALQRRLEQIPLASAPLSRSDSESVMDRLLAVARQYVEQGRSGLWLRSELESRLLNKHHESKEGKLELDRVIIEMMQGMDQRMRSRR